MKNFSAAVCIPSVDYQWSLEFSLCLMNMGVYFSRVVVPGYDANGLMVLNKRGSILPQLRQGLVLDALKAGATHILFLDTDQVFPADTLHQLAQWDKEVVACNIPIKAVPSAPTARNKSEIWWGGNKVFSHDRTGLEEVWRVGTGVMLLKREVFEQISLPYFLNEYDEENGEFLGEDWYLCHKLEQAGIPIYIDHDLSKEIEHVGTHNYSHDEIWTPEDEARMRG